MTIQTVNGTTISVTSTPSSAASPPDAASVNFLQMVRGWANGEDVEAPHEDPRIEKVRKVLDDLTHQRRYHRSQSEVSDGALNRHYHGGAADGIDTALRYLEGALR